MRLKSIWLFIPILLVQACNSTVSVTPGSRSESATEDALRRIESVESLRLLRAECDRITVFPTTARKYVEISKGGDTIFIGYELKVTFQHVATRIKSDLLPLGWRVEKEGRSVWEDQLELVNEKFRIVVSKNLFEESEYVVGCTNLGMPAR
jgi:hypothetical protein